MFDPQEHSKNKMQEFFNWQKITDAKQQPQEIGPSQHSACVFVFADLFSANSQRFSVLFVCVSNKAWKTRTQVCSITAMW